MPKLPTELEKPYDLNVLAKRLKARGLDLAEESIALFVEELFDWVEDSALASPTPVDDIAGALLPHLKPLVLRKVDELDGEDDDLEVD